MDIDRRLAFVGPTLLQSYSGDLHQRVIENSKPGRVDRDGRLIRDQYKFRDHVGTARAWGGLR
jgi:hypothetical protein